VIPDLWKNWWAQTIILISITAGGAEHWLFALEYYMSAQQITSGENINHKGFM